MTGLVAIEPKPGLPKTVTTGTPAVLPVSHSTGGGSVTTGVPGEPPVEHSTGGGSVTTTAPGTPTAPAGGTGLPAPTQPTAPTLPSPVPPPAPINYGSTSVEERVAGISAKDSNLNRMAEQEAMKVMNRRGLANTSMAVGAARDAVLKNAIPIASQDAAQAFQGQESALNRASTEKLSLAQIASNEGMAAAQRALDERMQKAALDNATQQQIRDIQSREGIAAAERKLQELSQQRDIAYRTQQADLDRKTQEKLASWNLKSSDRNAAAQFLTNMEHEYENSVSSIMANTNLTADQRQAQLLAAKQMRDRRLNFVEQMYNIDLKWDDTTTKKPTTPVKPTTPTKKPTTPTTPTTKTTTNFYSR